MIYAPWFYGYNDGMNTTNETHSVLPGDLRHPPILHGEVGHGHHLPADRQVASPKWAKVHKTWQCAGIFGRLAPTKSVVKKPGEWNRMTITCQGPKIYVILNDEHVTEIDMKKWTSAKKNPDGSGIPAWLNRPLAEMATKGHVGLQGKHAGAPIYFRNVKIKALD